MDTFVLIRKLISYIKLDLYLRFVFISYNTDFLSFFLIVSYAIVTFRRHRQLRRQLCHTSATEKKTISLNYKLIYS